MLDSWFSLLYNVSPSDRVAPLAQWETAVSINQEAEFAEYLIAQSRRELRQRRAIDRQPSHNGQALVRIADTWVTPETAAEFLQECA